MNLNTTSMALAKQNRIAPLNQHGSPYNLQVLGVDMTTENPVLIEIPHYPYVPTRCFEYFTSIQVFLVSSVLMGYTSLLIHNLMNYNLATSSLKLVPLVLLIQEATSLAFVLVLFGFKTAFLQSSSKSCLDDIYTYLDKLTIVDT